MRADGWRSSMPDVLPPVISGAVMLAVAAGQPESRIGADLGAYLLAVASVLVLFAHRRRPVTVLLITTACAYAYQFRGYPELPAFPMIVALFSTVRSGHRFLAIVIAAVAFKAGLVFDMTVFEGEEAREAIRKRFQQAGWIIAGIGVGEAFRQWTRHIDEVKERATEAERTREETARRRAGEERLRIARELHDSLTHTISVIKVQAGVAVHLARKRGEEVPAALLAIQEASGEAMRELRATLEVLREPGAEEAGLERLPDLVERVRSAGLRASVTISGEQREIPPDVDLAAYRIVQEALTNVARHAGPASVSVRIGYAADTLTVQVDDDGQATPGTAPEPGTGLTGMQERVSSLGGMLRAVPRSEGGFTVRAELPLAAS